MIEPIDSIAEWNKVVHHVHIAPAVFAHPMNDQQYGFYILFWKPTLIM